MSRHRFGNFCPKYSVLRLRSAASLLEVTVTVYTCTLRKRKSLKPLKKASFFFYESCQPVVQISMVTLQSSFLFERDKVCTAIFACSLYAFGLLVMHYCSEDKGPTKFSSIKDLTQSVPRKTLLNCDRHPGFQWHYSKNEIVQASAMGIRAKRHLTHF